MSPFPCDLAGDGDDDEPFTTRLGVEVALIPVEDTTSSFIPSTSLLPSGASPDGVVPALFFEGAGTGSLAGVDAAVAVILFSLDGTEAEGFEVGGVRRSMAGTATRGELRGLSLGPDAATYAPD